MPFGYLEFLRAIRGKPCIHMRAAAGGGRRGGPDPGSGSLPGSVLFEPGLTGTLVQRIAPAPSGPVQRLKENRTRTIATVCAVFV